MQNTKKAPTGTNDFVGIATLEEQGGQEYGFYIGEHYVRVFFDRSVSDDFKVIGGDIQLTEKELDGLYKRLCDYEDDNAVPESDGETPYNEYNQATSTLANRS